MSVGFGTLTDRTVCAHVVSRSSASLPPCETPWSKMAGLGAAAENGGSLAKPLPPCTARELPLKSVTLSRAALQLLMRVSCAPLIFEYRPSRGSVLRGPSGKIHVTPSERPNGWHEAHVLHALFDCLPRDSSGTISRIGVPT